MIICNLTVTHSSQKCPAAFRLNLQICFITNNKQNSRYKALYSLSVFSLAKPGGNSEFWKSAQSTDKLVNACVARKE